MKAKLIVHIVAEYDRWEKKYRYVSWPVAECLGDKTLVESREIEFEEPPAEALTAGTVAAYRAEQERIRAEATAKVTALQASIDEMLSIEHKAEA